MSESEEVEIHSDTETHEIEHNDHSLRKELEEAREELRLEKAINERFK